MGIELTAVRMQAPFFGDSAYVWTNVIGVILLALAIGAFTGGRLAERPAGSPIAALLLGAAALTALSPWLAPPLARWLLPGELPLDAAMPVLVRGSLLTTIVLFAPAVWLLGAVTPGLVVACVRAGRAIGPATGAIGAAGTLGSLLGTFAATHWSVPTLGSQATMWLCAGLLAVAALLCGRPVHGAAAALIGLLPLASALVPLPGLGTTWPAERLLAERESRHQFLRVVGTTEADGHDRVQLKINEGLDSFHSLAIVGRVLTSDPTHRGTPSSYFDYHALAPFLAADGRRPAALRALSIGDAAGTFRRIYAGVHPEAVVDGVELDPAAVELGDRWFPGARAPGQVVGGLDGRVFVEHARQQWHVVHVDAYAHQVAIPAHLASREFFAAVHRRLLPGGIIACNVGGLEPGDPVVQAIGGTLASVFGDAAALQVPRSRNFLLVARRGQPLQPDCLRGVDPGDHGLDAADAITWQAIVATAAQATWTRFAPAVEPLVDDRPLLDQLIHDSYLAVADDPAAVVVAGHAEPADAELAAYEAQQRGSPRATLAAVQGSARATPYLRFLAGRSRWQLRELRGAEAELVAGLALDPEPQLRADLERDLEQLRLQLVPLDAAAAMQRRNGLLTVGSAAALVAMAAAVYRMSRMPAAPSVSVSTAAR